MRKVNGFVTIISIVSVLIIFLIFPFFNFKNKAIKNGNQIVIKIEAFINEKGYLPDSFQDVNLKSDEFWGGMATSKKGVKYYFKKISDVDYIIYFDYALGESITYNSETKKWNYFSDIN